jgi:hypothetical protein
VSSGAYVTHGETFFQEDEVIWWAKGGVLKGESVARIRFLKDLLSSLPQNIESLSHQKASNPNESKPTGNEENTDYFTVALFKLPEAERNRRILELIPARVGGPDYLLEYLGRECSAFRNLELPDAGRYQVEIIDAWEMTRRVFVGEASGQVRVTLPAKEGIALLVTRLSGKKLIQ